MKIFAVIGLSLATAFSGVAPAEAFPSFPSQRLAVSDVQQVAEHRYPRRWSRGYSDRNWRRYARNRYDNGYRYDRYRYGGYRNDRYRYNRYRYGHYRPYYRPYYRNYDDYDDFGLVIGGLAAGAIIGGLMTQPYYAPRYYAPYAPRYYSGNYGAGGHASWCYARYRSYRAYDNTFQPYYGPRRQCISPYR